MNRIDQIALADALLADALLADALLAAPGWARVGLSAPTVRMREDAAGELVRVIISEIEPAPLLPPDQGQLPL